MLSGNGDGDLDASRPSLVTLGSLLPVPFGYIFLGIWV